MDHQYSLLADRDALGVYGRTATFETALTHLQKAISRLDTAADAELLRFPPVIARRTVERCGYLHSFPQLLGTIYAFAGDVRGHSRLMDAVASGEDWGPHQQLTDLVLTPAACYAVYPHVADGLRSQGRLIDVESWCFRQEPSNSLERMRSFRMREFVRVGAADVVQAWREAWVAQAKDFLDNLGLAPSVAPANDPFFGTGARFLAASQRDQELKFELNVEVVPGVWAAGMSCNYHLDHFGEAFAIRLPDGVIAHTACVGFGLERLSLALLTAHGLAPATWPANVRNVLAL
jgi:seryl-tRNA synthetase